MSRLLLCLATAAVLSAADRPAFDAADIHVIPRADWSKVKPMQGGYLAGDRFEFHRATLLDLIGAAYSVDADKVYGGPSWLDYDRYEIAAKAKSGTRPETLRLMLQSLIEDRFKVAVKMDTRDVPGYILSKGKGELKVRPSEAGAPSGGCGVKSPHVEDGVMHSLTECRGMTMAAFADFLRPRMSAGALARMPLVDSTGLDGQWDISYETTVRLGEVSPLTPAARAIEEMATLGLKLELGRVPQPVLVVENATEQPTPNAPDVTAALPPLPPPEFDVATIKWPCNDDHTANLRFLAGGRVEAICSPIQGLIRDAFGLGLNETPAGLPKWLTDNTSTKYNISIFAKAPANVAAGPQHNQQARDVLNAMLRKLLIDRYRMKVHYEDRPVDAQTLVAVKPKLTKADPEGRTGCKRESQQDKGMSIIVKLVCRNMTMTQFAEQIQSLDSHIPYPVVDQTGLEGAWDFTLNYDVMAWWVANPPPVFARARANASPDAPAAEPSGSLSLADAIEKQLGLKLEVRKRPVKVLVIDRMEEKPIEN